MLHNESFIWSRDLDDGSIAGIVIGSICAVALLIALSCWLYHKYKPKGRCQRWIREGCTSIGCAASSVRREREERGGGGERGERGGLGGEREREERERERERERE